MMFRPEHEMALRHQIRSLDRLQLSESDGFGVEFNAIVKDQAALLEEIRIEIHNQLQAGRKQPLAGLSLELSAAEIAQLEKKARLENGILA